MVVCFVIVLLFSVGFLCVCICYFFEFVCLLSYVFVFLFCLFVCNFFLPYSREIMHYELKVKCAHQNASIVRPLCQKCCVRQFNLSHNSSSMTGLFALSGLAD